MIDNPDKTERLLEWLDEVLPLPAMMTPELAKIFTEGGPDLVPLQPCQILGLSHAGGSGGILCYVNVPEKDEKRIYITSIMYLRFDRRLPIAASIAAYQKHRASACCANTALHQSP